MLSTWLFIIIVGNAAQSIEVEGMRECIELRQYVDAQIAKNEALKGKVATGCFKNLGERTHES